MKSYKGLQGSKKGVVGMLEVISSDFLRVEADKKAKHEQEVKLRLDKDQAEFERGQLEKDLATNEAQLQRANAYYEDLKPSCVETHVSFEERSARRTEEIAALKEAYKVL